MSYMTAITRRKVSLPMKWLAKNHKLLSTDGALLDYGCGRGFDVQAFGILGYDPSWEPYTTRPNRKFLTVTCNYVLNVVTPDEQEKILDDVRGLLLPEGIAYFSVRRDLPREGKPGRGCYQRYVELDYPSVYKCSGFEIYAITNH